MSTPSLSYLLLDADYDPVFVPGAALAGTYAVAQAILTRLNLWYGEWWENLNLGLPVFQSILGQLGSASGIAAMELLIQQNVEGAPFVTAVNSVEASFVNNQLSYTIKVQTAFGPATVSNLPGSSANLGG